MRLENITPEQIEQAKKHEAIEEHVPPTEEGAAELVDEQMEDLAGGAEASSVGECSGTGKNAHYWYDTGETRPSRSWTSDLPERKMRCKKCGKTYWQKVNFA